MLRGGVVSNLARLLGNSVGLGVAAALSRYRKGVPSKCFCWGEIRREHRQTAGAFAGGAEDSCDAARYCEGRNAPF
jgi:hypothetical protein